MWKHCLFIISVLFIFQQSNSQTIGGNAVYNFLKLPASPQISALGGINVSHQSNDLSIIFQNPSLLRDSMEGQVSASFNAIYGEIKNLHAITSFHHKKWETNFAIGVSYLNYGKVSTTDAAENVLGDFRPADYVIQAEASRKYESHWYYGIALKFIHSDYGTYNSSGIAGDFGVTYLNSENGFQAGFAAKNMGVQIKKYSMDYEDLPFDVEIGISQKLKKVPLQISITAHHLHQFNIRYSDSTFNNINLKKDYTFDKILRHFILATQLYLGEKIEITAGYNFLRAKELSISNLSHGANGLGFGIGGIFKKLQVRYAMAFFQSSKAYNQLGINFRWREKEF